MSTISIRLPNYLHNSVRKLAENEDVSINHFITLAVAEKISAILTETYLEERGKKGSKKRFDAILARVPGTDPDERDRIK